MPEKKWTGDSVILGLTGSLGSGKTFVSSLLSRAAAPVICADRIAREVVASGTPALQEIVEAFGRDLLAPDGSLNRQRLGMAVFGDPEKRRLLESIVHPRVRARELQFIEENRGSPLIVVDVPLLFETGFEVECTATMVVLVSEEVRFSRLRADRGMTPDEIERRLASQLPQREKARRASFLVDNSSSRQYTCNQVNRILRRIFAGNLPAPLQPTTLP